MSGTDVHSECPSLGRNSVAQVNSRKVARSSRVKLSLSFLPAKPLYKAPAGLAPKLTRQSGTHNSSIALQPACRSGNCYGSPGRQHRPSAVFVALFTRLISSDVGGSVSLQPGSPGASASSGKSFTSTERRSVGGSAGASSHAFRDPQIRLMMMMG